jgi:hypothetical protein
MNFDRNSDLQSVRDRGKSVSSVVQGEPKKLACCHFS